MPVDYTIGSLGEVHISPREGAVGIFNNRSVLDARTVLDAFGINDYDTTTTDVEAFVRDINDAAAHKTGKERRTRQKAAAKKLADLI